MTLSEWATQHHITLLADAGNQKVCAFYLSSDDETAQIVLEDTGKAFRVDVWSVETHNDEEFHRVYSVAKNVIGTELDKIVEGVRKWLTTRDPLP